MTPRRIAELFEKDARLGQREINQLLDDWRRAPTAEKLALVEEVRCTTEGRKA